MNPKSASALVWSSAILNVVALVAMDPALRFPLFVVAALCAALPALRARERARTAALSALAASAVLAALAYQPFISHMNQYRRHAEKQPPAPKIEPPQNG